MKCFRRYGFISRSVAAAVLQLSYTPHLSLPIIHMPAYHTHTVTHCLSYTCHQSLPIVHMPPIIAYHAHATNYCLSYTCHQALPIIHMGLMCGLSIDTCFFKPNWKNISLEQHSAKPKNVLLTPPQPWNRRNNDFIHTCGTVTTTNMTDFYKDARAHYPHSGKYIRLLFMEHLHCIFAEKCS